MEDFYQNLPQGVYGLQFITPLSGEPIKKHKLNVLCEYAECIENGLCTPCTVRGVLEHLSMHNVLTDSFS